MTTQCNETKLIFHDLDSREVVGRFDGGEITSDAGAVLLREVEKRTRVLGRMSECFADHRDPERIEHTVESLVKQRVMGLCLGYEDLNDHDELCRDRRGPRPHRAPVPHCAASAHRTATPPAASPGTCLRPAASPGSATPDAPPSGRTASTPPPPAFAYTFGFSSRSTRQVPRDTTSSTKSGPFGSSHSLQLSRGSFSRFGAPTTTNTSGATTPRDCPPRRTRTCHRPRTRPTASRSASSTPSAGRASRAVAQGTQPSAGHPSTDSPPPPQSASLDSSENSSTPHGARACVPNDDTTAMHPAPRRPSRPWRGRHTPFGLVCGTPSRRTGQTDMGAGPGR